MTKYLWKNIWLWPYESVWSIIEKFKYINVITNKEIIKIFDMGKGVKTKFNKDHYIYHNMLYNTEKLNIYFRLDNRHFAPMNILENNNPINYVDDNVYYCPECIKSGYHSYFHQLKFLDICVFHNIKLEKAYDENGKPIKYSLLTNNYQAYKTNCDTSQKSYNKFFNLPPATELILYNWHTKDAIYKYQFCKYKNIRFINSTSSPNIKQCEYDFLKDVFLNKNLSKKPIVTFYLQECIEKYNEIYKYVWNYVYKYKGEPYINQFSKLHIEKYIKSYAPNLYMRKLLIQYLNNNKRNMMDEIYLINEVLDLVFKHSCVVYNDFIRNKITKVEKAFSLISIVDCCDYRQKNTIAIIYLICYLAGSENIRTSLNQITNINLPKSHYNKCVLNIYKILEQKIDNNYFSTCLNYYIFSKIVDSMYNIILKNINAIKIERPLHNEIDFDNMLPNFIVLSTQHDYTIYEFN